MKTLEIKFLKSYNAIILVLLAALGFASSCKKPEPKVEYGVPTAKFIIKGKIELTTDNSALQNIKVKIQNDSVTSDVNGNYQITKSTYAGNQTFQIQFRDVDGTLNGEIAPLDTTVEFINPQFVNGDGEWYSGETQKEFDVKLKPK